MHTPITGFYSFLVLMFEVLRIAIKKQVKRILALHALRSYNSSSVVCNRFLHWSFSCSNAAMLQNQLSPGIAPKEYQFISHDTRVQFSNPLIHWAKGLGWPVFGFGCSILYEWSKIWVCALEPESISWANSTLGMFALVSHLNFFLVLSDTVGH